MIDAPYKNQEKYIYSKFLEKCNIIMCGLPPSYLGS